MVTRFKVLPRAGNALQIYQGRLRCDLEGQRLLDFAILSPDAGEASVLQLGGGKLPGGTWWEYVPDGQTVITNGAPSSGYADYCATPGSRGTATPGNCSRVSAWRQAARPSNEGRFPS